MKIEILNFGKVSRVAVDLDGLTVIAGKNGTGKSTVSRVLMSYFTLQRRMGEHIRDARIKSIVEFLSDKLPLPGPVQWRLRRLSTASYDDIPYDILQREFWDDSKYLILLLRRIIPTRRVVEGSEKMDDELRAIFTEIQHGAFEIIDRDDAEYVELIYRTKFNQIFKGQILPLFNPTAVATLSVEDKSGMRMLSFQGDAMPCFPVGGKPEFQTVLYLEPINILDAIGDDGDDKLDDRYDSGDRCWSLVLKTNRYDRNVSLEKDRKISDAKKSLESVSAILHGSLVDVDGEVKFKEEGIDQPIELLNVASGVKSMAMLIKAIRNGSLQEGDLLIADEPESNLHPEWQVRFAEFLVLLKKELGIKVLLNTHSPYFLKAIESYAKKYDSCNDVHYYFMRDIGGGATESEEITSDLTVAYEALYKPLAAIMEA